MAFLKGVFLFIVALTMALSLSIMLAKQGITQQQQQSKPPSFVSSDEDKLNIQLPSRKVSRFLAANVKPRNPNAADHCHKDHEVCYLAEVKNSTCCNNKCVDLDYDDKNCGACKNKCKFTHTCCRGQCVQLAYDKRHCGACNNRCAKGEYCVYGMCNYA